MPRNFEGTEGVEGPSGTGTAAAAAEAWTTVTAEDLRLRKPDAVSAVMTSVEVLAHKRAF